MAYNLRPRMRAPVQPVQLSSSEDEDQDDDASDDASDDESDDESDDDDGFDASDPDDDEPEVDAAGNVVENANRQPQRAQGDGQFTFDCNVVATECCLVEKKRTPRRRQGQRGQLKRVPVMAPVQWHEYYTHITVEHWMLWWLQTMFRSESGGWADVLRLRTGQVAHRILTEIKPRLQFQMKGKYLIPGTQTARELAKVDFAWIPGLEYDDENVQKECKDPIVLLEIDENQHRRRGFDNERGREWSLFNLLQEQFPKCPRITIVRFNPHEYRPSLGVSHSVARSLGICVR
jgi:hypothetical protein